MVRLRRRFRSLAWTLILLVSTAEIVKNGRFLVDAFGPIVCLRGERSRVSVHTGKDPGTRSRKEITRFSESDEIDVEPSHPLQRAKNPSTGRWINISPFVKRSNSSASGKGHPPSRRRAGVWDSLMRRGGWIAYNRHVVPLFPNANCTKVDAQDSFSDNESMETWYALEPTLEAWNFLGAEGNDSSVPIHDASELPLLDELLWVYKPPGLLTLPDVVFSSESFPSPNKIRKSKKKARETKKPWIPRPCHRLDKDTSGIIVVAKTREAYKAVSRQFEERLVRKRYVALVEGRMADEPNEGTINKPIGSLLAEGKNHKVWSTSPMSDQPREARTRWRVSHRYEGIPGTPVPDYTRLLLYPKTGRGHQLRLHTAEVLGHPILGDTLHGSFKGAPRLCLHAEYLELWVRDEKDEIFRTKCWCLPPF